MTNNHIKVRRFTSTEAYELFTEQPLSEEEVLNYLSHCGDNLPWEETEVITHYQVVENFA